MSNSTIFFANQIIKRGGIVCAFVIFSVAGLSLIGWFSGKLILASYGADYIPMAPNTALLFLVITANILVRSSLLSVKWIRRLSLTVSSVTVLISVLVIIQSVFNFDLENLIYHTTITLGSIPIGRMSFLTALVFLLAGISFLLLETGFQQKYNFTVILASVVTIIGFVVILGYWRGTPLLYGGNQIPMAITTSICFMFLGCGLFTCVGSRSQIVQTFTGNSVRSRMFRVFIPSMMLLTLLI